MQPNYSSIGQVFSAQTRYTVPLFQRPYVWNKDEQWQPLWDDVRALADRVLNPPSHKPVAGHFLGTVVLEQLKTAAIAMPQRQVIDGQQRLTTLQLLLKAAEHALTVARNSASDEQARQIEMAAGQIGQLSKNQFASEPDEAFKVWPTNEDREPFRAVMDSPPDLGVGGQTTRMAEAYKFFRAAVFEWLKGSDMGTRALAIASALKDHLRLIVLDLDETDEPQAIFETLNAHGTPLLPADLIKNWLLWQAAKQGKKADTLYLQHWVQFDREHDYWRQNIGTGHAARPRVDVFLQSWLTVETGEAVPVKHLYDRFLAFANAASDPESWNDVDGLMATIKSHAENYAVLDRPAGDSDFAKALARLNRLDFVVFRPVLMAVMARAGSDAADRLNATTALESFLVRRMVCEMQTRGYGNLALSLIQAIQAADPEGPAAPAIVSVLTDAPGEWPTDDQFRHSWCTRRFYGWLRRDRVAMILQALEEHLQSEASKSEPVLIFNYSKLTIEHIMPQSWAANWPLTAGISAEERDALVQNIGNLTLVSDKLNPSLSNSAWLVERSETCKRAALAKHSDLKLNKQLLASNPFSWTENSIRGRAADLFVHAAGIWSDPQRFAVADRQDATIAAERCPNCQRWTTLSVVDAQHPKW